VARVDATMKELGYALPVNRTGIHHKFSLDFPYPSASTIVRLGKIRFCCVRGEAAGRHLRTSAKVAVHSIVFLLSFLSRSVPQSHTA